MRHRQKPRGDRIAVQEHFLSPLRGSDFYYFKPTADAVGYRLIAAPQLFTARKN